MSLQDDSFNNALPPFANNENKNLDKAVRVGFSSGLW